MSTALITLSDLQFAWPGQPTLLDIPEFTLERGQSLFLKGPSGSGKTTLLGLLGGVQQAASGRVSLLGEDLGRLSSSARDRFRVDHTGYIFHGSVAAAAAALLSHLGLADEALQARRADSLSIGQQQRVAAARALIGQPELVIADEPTSALDADAREAFLHLLFTECRAAGASLLFVSHDQSLAHLFDRSLSLAELNRAATPAEV